MGMRQWASLALVLALSNGARAEDKDWFEQEEGTAPEQGDTAAAQESGEVELDPSSGGGGGGGGGWLTPGSLSVFGGLHLGVGGKVEFDQPGPTDVEDDLAATFGLQAGADYVLIPYFALGGELRLGWWNREASDDRSRARNLLFDIVVKPRGRYVLESIGLELYGTLPLGLTVPSISDDNGGGDTSPGFTLGVLGGATYFVTEHLGVNGEAGLLWHFFGAQAAGVEADASLRQLTLLANGVYAF